MSKSRTINTFTGGMDTNSLPELASSDSYGLAINAVDQSSDHTGFGLTNELGNRLVLDLEGTIKGWSYIEDIDATLFFVYNGQSEIHLFYHKTETTKFVVSDAEFGCDWGFDGCEFLYGEFKRFNACNELHVYWSSDCVFHVVNIDEMLNPKRKASIPKDECDYFEVFGATCSPTVTSSASKFAGGILEGGVVSFAVQLRDEDNNLSNVFQVSQPVYLETEDQIPGQISPGAASLQVTGINSKWRDVIVYVIHKVSGVETIKRMRARGVSGRGFTFTYYGQDGELVPPETIYKKSSAWIRGKDLIQKDGRMYFYNAVHEKNLNYQKYANAIQLSGIVYETSLEQQQKYHFPTLMRGEVYAVGIVWNYLDGTHSPAFHIPAVGGSSGVQVRSESGEAEAPAEMEFDDRYQAAPQGSYKPMGGDNFDSESEFERKRNPQDIKDRPQESDQHEDLYKAIIDSWTTTTGDVTTAAECEECTKECACCGCQDYTQTCTTVDDQGNTIQVTTCVIDKEDKVCDCSILSTSVAADVPKKESSETSIANLFTAFGLDKPDFDPTSPSTYKESASKVVEDAIRKREYFEKRKPKVIEYTNDKDSGNPRDTDEVKSMPKETRRTFDDGRTGPTTVVGGTSNGVSIRGDNWVDQSGNSLTDEPIRKIGTTPFKAYESSIPYPDDKDCDGERFYPEGNVTYIKVPDTSEVPHFVSNTNGVVNKYQPDNYEWGSTRVRPIGIRADNIHIPEDSELPKPLCPNNPYSLVYVKRTQNNKRVFAKGWMSGMFRGEVYGTDYLYPRHGVNSFETVDAMISPSGNPDSRKGSHFDDPYYTFHSPDTDADRSYLPVTNIRGELTLRGSGWRHGLYAKGREPDQNQWTGTRVDNLGARVSNNLNHYTAAGTESTIEGISYAPGNTKVTTPDGMNFPLMNRYRESSVYLRAGARMPGDSRDQSFVGDVLNHYGPTVANAPYVTLYRDLPDQYGPVESLQYIRLGIEARPIHQSGGSIEGICGDAWIGAYSKRRTSYVSNKKGNTYNVPNKEGSPCRARTICDTPEDKLFEYFGWDYYSTKLPKSGDKWDPKNYAGLHTIAGTCGADGRSKTLAEAMTAGDSESDYYFPGTLKSLVCTVVESNVNPYFLQTGEGPQKVEGKVYYPKLKDLELDSDAPAKHDWEDSFLNRFYKKQEQPSLKQRTLKALIRTIINLIVPVLGLTMFSDMEGVLDTVGTLAAYPLMSALWIFANNTLFTNRRLDEMLGIEVCRRDEEGGDLDSTLKNWEDIYARVSWDYAQVNDFESFLAFPLPYNTCDCLGCDDSSDLVFFTNKQIPNSEIDAYRRAKLSNFFNIPSTAGRVQKIFKMAGRLFVHTTEGILPVQDLDTGDLVVYPQIIGGDISQGIYGTHSPNAAIMTPFGYFFIDEEALKVYQFDGSSAPQEVSTAFMRQFFQKHLKFCEETDCYDEKVTGTSYYTMGWDPKLDRLLVTKNEPNASYSFTASYSPRKERWISFHTYTPNGYQWTRSDLLSVISDKGQMWKHHEPRLYQEFYGEQAEFMVEYTVKVDQLLDDGGVIRDFFKTETMQIDAEFQSGDILDLDTFFTKAWFRNSTQSTGLRPTRIVSDDAGKRRDVPERLTENYSSITAIKNSRVWTINDIKDLVETDCNERKITQQDECEVIPSPVESIIDCRSVSNQDYMNRTMHDQYLTVRLIFDGSTDKRLYLKKVITKVTT